jgi:uracil phosphoribosyltransferase
MKSRGITGQVVRRAHAAGAVDGYVLARKVTLVPVLRAGLGMADGVLAILPTPMSAISACTATHDTLEPVPYYQKAAADIVDTEVLVIDPMLATGGSAVSAIEFLKRAGVTNLRFMCLVAAPEGIKALHTQHPDVPVYCAAIDRQLDHRGYILPGLGDAGDRIYGT